MKTDEKQARYVGNSISLLTSLFNTVINCLVPAHFATVSRFKAECPSTV